MIALIPLFGFLLAMVVGEAVIRGKKSQTGVTRLLVVHAVLWAAAATVLCLFYEVSFFAVSLFWGGAFLSWFVVRSHIESSILLGMVAIAKKEPLPESEILARYESAYGLPQRKEELVKAGLAEMVGGDIGVTRKGRIILAAHLFMDEGIVGRIQTAEFRRQKDSRRDAGAQRREGRGITTESRGHGDS